MSERWEQLTFLGSISSAGASHVRTSAAQVAEPASPPEPAPDSGSNSTESSASSCPSGSSSKTSRRGLGGGCPVCGTTCGLGDTEHVPTRFLPPTSGRLNSGDGSSSSLDRLWPTATATPYGSTNNGTRDGSTKYATAGTPSLDTIAKLWPTAIASDAKRGALTPGSSQAEGSLTKAVVGHMWPTATAMDAAASRRNGYMVKGHQGTTLTDAMDQHIDGPHASETRKGGRSTQVLNPEFVESLMGFPPGWTDPD